MICTVGGIKQKKGAMNICPVDIAALRAPDVLQEYCRAALGAGKQIGRLTFYPCPYGSHTRPKLETTEKDGCGVAMCRACNRGGTVYDIAAAVEGIDPRKDFARCVQTVADAVGYTLADTGTENAPKKSHRRRKGAFSACWGISAPPAEQTPAEKLLELLPPEEEAAALDAVRRLAARPDLQAQFAAMLNLPPWIIQSHADIQECACRGLLGVDKRERLLYVYTSCPADGEPVRVLGVKTRNPQGVEPRFLMRGRKSALWGIDSAEYAGMVIVTEGESDALAVRASVESELEKWLTDEPETYPEKALPAVVAKPDAGTFRESWAHALRGKSVVLLADGDEAGQKGAEATAEALKKAGVRMVKKWTPAEGKKDARTAFDPARPWLLMRDIITRMTDI